MGLLRWNALACKLQGFGDHKLNIVKSAYCIGRPLIRKCQCSDPMKNTYREIKSLYAGHCICL